ncbi:MAG: hypothetical protein RL161_374, partial [Bacteroidota bacterium]
GNAHANLPTGFTVHPKLAQLLQKRVEMSREGGIDWGFGELLAFGSLLIEGTKVRLAGQDARRGTFVQRHATFFDRETGAEWMPLSFITEQQAQLQVYNSLLSEYAAMGFEYGYSVEEPNALTLWEAQFGDFANGAQVMIDQFLSSSESKWQRQNGMVLMLPHGYEGQGPEHSSCRPERFLQLSAEYNMVVLNLTTSANLFHMLRRQVKWEFRKPAVLFSPKSLLRHPGVVSSIKEFTDGIFREVIDDPNAGNEKVTRLILCTGKLFYELQEVQQKKKLKHVAIVRIEQLFPFPENQVNGIFKKYKGAEIVWAQEEPLNMGYWSFMVRMLPEVKMKLVSRKASASPATGYNKVHKMEQERIINDALGI